MTSRGLPGNIEELPSLFAREGRRSLVEGVQEGKRLLAPIVQAWKDAAPRDQVAAFERIRGSLVQDPRAQFALDALVESGKLTGSRAALDGKSLLETLDAAWQKNATPPLQMPVILADVVQDLADPSAINQGLRGTCTAASLQMIMAHSDPAEYARIVTGLASGSGTVRLRGGKDLQREPESLQKDDSRRTDASRLFEDAVIQLEVSIPGLDYRNPAHTIGKEVPNVLFAPDGSTVPSTQDKAFKTGKGVAQAQSALTGSPHQEVMFRPDPLEILEQDARAGKAEALKLQSDMGTRPHDPSVGAAFTSYLDRSIARHQNEVFQRMDRALEAGHPLSIGIETSAAGHAGHQISLVGKEKGPDGMETYLALNSWGTTHRFTRKDLEAIMLGVSLPSTP